MNRKQFLLRNAEDELSSFTGLLCNIKTKLTLFHLCHPMSKETARIYTNKKVLVLALRICVAWKLTDTYTRYKACECDMGTHAEWKKIKKYPTDSPSFLFARRMRGMSFSWQYVRKESLIMISSSVSWLSRSRASSQLNWSLAVRIEKNNC